MPQDGSSNYQYPPGTPGIPDTTIESEAYNTFLDDLVTNDLNIPRPVHRGGTGASNANAALVNLTAEKATQVVTDYSAHLWLPGSFYSASSATAAPVSGHAFAGICYINEPLVYPPTNANVTVEARDMTDGKLYVRIKTAGVWAVAGWLIDGTDAFVNVTGDTMSGPLNITTPGADPGAQLAVGDGLGGSFIIAKDAPGNVYLGADASTDVGYGVWEYYNLSRGTSAARTAVALNDQPWGVGISGHDGVISRPVSASIISVVDAAVSTADVPIGLSFLTGNSTIPGGVERLRIKSDGKVVLPTPVAIVDADQVPTKAYVDAMGAAATSGMQINGGMQVNQELGTSGVAVSNNTLYIADVYTVSINGAGVVGIQSQTAVVPPGFTHAVILNCTTPNPLSVATDYQWFEHRIEGYRWSRLGWGAAGAQPVTIGFWIQPPISGTMAVAVQTLVSPFRTYVVDVPVTAAAWQYKTVTIPGDVAGTWPKDNTIGAAILFVFGVGSSRQTTANVWATQGTAVGTAATTNFFAAGGFTYITGITVLPGTQAPTAAQSPLITRPYDQELATCMRYYEKLAGTVNGSYPGVGFNSFVIWYFKTTKRATPTIAYAAGSVVTATLSTTIQQHCLYATSTTSAIGTDTSADARL